MANHAQKIESISQLNTLIGQKTLHPLLSVIDLAEATRLGQLSISGDFYALFFKQVQCGDFRYGRRCHDFQSCTLVFKAPGQTIDITQHDTPKFSTKHHWSVRNPNTRSSPTRKTNPFIYPNGKNKLSWDA